MSTNTFGIGTPRAPLTPAAERSVARCEAGKAEIAQFQQQHDAFVRDNPRLAGQFRPDSPYPQMIAGALTPSDLSADAQSLLDYDALLNDCMDAEQAQVAANTGKAPHQYRGLEDIAGEEAGARLGEAMRDAQARIEAKLEALSERTRAAPQTIAGGEDPELAARFAANRGRAEARIMEKVDALMVQHGKK